jgi:hypothetical protein
MANNPVLESTQFLVANPQYVKINDEQVGVQAKAFAQREFSIPSWQECFPGKSLDESVELFCLANTTNFAFTNFETGEKYLSRWQNKDWTGAYGMYASINKALERGIPITSPKYLAQMSLDDVNQIFSEDSQIPLAEERRNVFNEVGAVLSDKYGSFLNLFNVSRGRVFNDGDGFVERLVSAFPSFNDSVVVDGKEVKIYKRAQLAAAEIQGRFLADGKVAFRDIEELTAFADYVLPKGLRSVGILEYSPDLTSRVDEGVLIPKNSLEEIEIRAASIHAFDRLLKEINSQRENKINVLHLDYAIWAEFRKKPGRHHLTKTIFY